MNRRLTLFIATALTILVAVPVSFSFAQNSDAENESDSELVIDQLEGPEQDYDEELEDEQTDWESEEDLEFEEEDESWDEEDELEEGEHDDRDALIEHAFQTVDFAESKPAVAAYVIDLLIESMDEDRVIDLLTNIKTSDTTTGRVITLRLAQLYAEMDQPEKIEQLLMELCP